MFNALWTVLYVPCLTMPAGAGPDGLPVGIQLVGRRHEDAKLLDVALWVERALGYGNDSGKPSFLRRRDRAACFRGADRRGADPRLSRPCRRACIGQGLDMARPGAGAGAGARSRPRRAAGPASPGCRSASRTSSTPPTCRPDTARRSTAATGRSPTLPASRCLRMAGGTIIGKTVTTEFANRFPGATVNPHNPAHTPGRLVERLGRGSRRFPGPGGARHPDRRLGDPPLGVLRRRRLQAELRRIQPRRHQAAMP